MKRPRNYKEWRSLFHSEIHNLGMRAFFLWNGRGIKIDRDLVKLVSRVKRIRQQLDAEAQAFTKSYCEAIVDIITKRD